MAELLNIDSSTISRGRKDYIVQKLKQHGMNTTITLDIGRVLITKYSEDYSKILKQKIGEELEEYEILFYDTTEVIDMVDINWDDIPTGEYEKLDKLNLKLKEKVTGVFVGEGKSVEKKVLEKAGAKFPRDSHIFTLEIKGVKMDWWISQTNYSVLRQLKLVRENNEGKLDGAKVTIERVSDKMTENNYAINSA